MKMLTPKGIRIPVCSVKGSCPRPLDDGGNYQSGQRDSNARHQPWQGCALPLSYARYNRSNDTITILRYLKFVKLLLKLEIIAIIL